MLFCKPICVFSFFVENGAFHEETPSSLTVTGDFCGFPVEKSVDSVENCPGFAPRFFDLFYVYVNQDSVELQ